MEQIVHMDSIQWLWSITATIFPILQHVIMQYDVCYYVIWLSTEP